MKKILIYLITLCILSTAFLSCDVKLKYNVDINKDSIDIDNEKLLMATLFHQKAAEYRALSYQAYNIARHILDNELKKMSLNKKLAVIVDVDETVLDNSPFQAKIILEKIQYPEYWDEWCELAQAKALQGAVEFLNYAKSKGVEVFYVTNRKENLKEKTIKNLKEKGFPYADIEHLYMRKNESGKEKRRQAIAANYHIVLFIGDNLSDFSYVFDKKSIEERFFLTDSLKNKFGKRFIILPNSMYGAWYDALFDYNYNLTHEEKNKMFYEKLEGF